MKFSTRSMIKGVHSIMNSTYLSLNFTTLTVSYKIIINFRGIDFLH